MADLALKRCSDGSFDLDFKSSDLVTTDALENAIAISIGTYARERNLDVNKANLEPCKGGWWGDALDATGTLGGYLYEAFPGKLVESTAADVRRLVEESLKWLVDDGVATKVECETAIDGDVLTISVKVQKPNGSDESFSYSKNWAAQNAV